jgi:hypothetical protein
LTHAQVIEELNRRGCLPPSGVPWRDPRQIIKLLRSFPVNGEETA